MDEGGKWFEALVKETSSLGRSSGPAVLLPNSRHDNDFPESVAAGRPAKQVACHRDLGVFVISEGSDRDQQLFVFHPSGKTEIRLEGAFFPRKVERLLINRGASALCLLGLTECVIVNISYRAKQAIKRDDEPSITCAATTIAHDNEGIVHAAWHPASDRHLAVLTTDMVWRLYNKENPASTEQTFRLRPPRGFVNLISFSFGYGAIGWASFAVFFLSDEGDVYFLCPVFPHGCVVSAETIGEARSDLESRFTDGSFETFEAQNIQHQLAKKWLEETFGIDEQSVRSRRKARSLICAEAAQSFVRRSTTLQGPLKEDAHHHQDSRQASPEEVSSLVCLPTEPLVLLRGWSSGFVDVLFFVGEIAPHWATPELDSDRDFPFEDALRMFERLDLVLQEQAIRAPLEIHPDPLQPEYIYVTHGAGVHCAILHWLPSLKSASLSESLPSTELYVLFADPLHTGRVLPFRGCDFLEGLTLSGRYFLGLGWNGELVSLDITRKWPSLVDDALTPSSHEASTTTSLTTLTEELREARSDRQLAPLPEVPRGSSLNLDLFRNFAEQLEERKETLEIIYTLVERRVQLLHKIEDETADLLFELREEIGKVESKSAILQQKLQKVEEMSREINERIRTQTEKLNNLDDTRSDAEREYEQFLRRKTRQLKNLDEEVSWLRERGSSTAPSTPSARAGNRGAVLSPFEKQLAGSLKRTLEKLHKEKINAMKERVKKLDNELASLRL